MSAIQPDQPLEVLDLKWRLHRELTNPLDYDGKSCAPYATTVGELTAMSARELSRLPWIGAASLREIRRKLAAHGLYLRGEKAPEPPEPPEPTAVELLLTEISDKLDRIDAQLDRVVIYLGHLR